MTITGARRERAQGNTGVVSASATRAAIYLRVSTGRQAEHDLSIPDQKAQTAAWVVQRGWRVVAEYVEPGASATDDKRPQFQRMIERACDGENAFDVIVVHSFSRFFRDAFGLEFYLRKLAKHGVKLVSITQELGDDPAQVMMRQVIALFDEYQSKENAKHVLRCDEGKRAAGVLEWRAGTAWLQGHRSRAARRAHQEEARSRSGRGRDRPADFPAVRSKAISAPGPMGVKAITSWLNAHGHRTRTGGLWGLGRVHALLTNPVYAGRLRFNRMDSKSRRAEVRKRVRLLRRPTHHLRGVVRSRAEGPCGSQSQRGAAEGSERPDPAHRSRSLRHLRRRHDVAGRHIPNGTGLSLLLVRQRHAERKARLQRAIDPDGQARHARDRALGRPPAAA